MPRGESGNCQPTLLKHAGGAHAFRDVSSWLYELNAGRVAFISNLVPYGVAYALWARFVGDGAAYDLQRGTTDFVVVDDTKRVIYFDFDQEQNPHQARDENGNVIDLNARDANCRHQIVLGPTMHPSFIKARGKSRLWSRGSSKAQSGSSTKKSSALSAEENLQSQYTKIIRGKIPREKLLFSPNEHWKEESVKQYARTHLSHDVKAEARSEAKNR